MAGSLGGQNWGVTLEEERGWRSKRLALKSLSREEEADGFHRAQEAEACLMKGVLDQHKGNPTTVRDIKHFVGECVTGGVLLVQSSKGGWARGSFRFLAKM